MECDSIIYIDLIYCLVDSIVIVLGLDPNKALISLDKLGIFRRFRKI